MRNSIFDVAKGIGIWLVLLGHTVSYADNGLQKIIYSFHMPLFFMICGFFYKSNSTENTIKENWDRLIIPYFIIGFSCAIPSLLFGNTMDAWQFAKQTAGTIYSVPRSDWTFFCTPIWFLTCLFCIQVIYSTLRNQNELAKTLSVMGLFIAGISITKLANYYYPWNIQIALISIAFYHIGYWLKRADWFAADSSKTTHTILIIPTASVLYASIKFNPEMVNLAAGSTGNVLMFVASAISGSLLTLQISSILRDSSVLAFFGRNTVILFGYNYWFSKMGYVFFMESYGWLGSFLAQIPFYFALALLSERSDIVSRLLKRRSAKRQCKPAAA